MRGGMNWTVYLGEGGKIARALRDLFPAQLWRNDVLHVRNNTCAPWARVCCRGHNHELVYEPSCGKEAFAQALEDVQ